MAMTLDTTELESQQQEFLSEIEVLNGMLQQMIRQNATAYADGRLTFTFKNGSTFEG